MRGAVEGRKGNEKEEGISGEEGGKKSKVQMSVNKAAR